MMFHHSTSYMVTDEWGKYKTQAGQPADLDSNPGPSEYEDKNFTSHVTKIHLLSNQKTFPVCLDFPFT
jgi:hypothetical protein